jgi:flagellar basal-body rod protein FlgB
MIANDLTIELISKSLDADQLRQEVISNNIANKNTQNYQALKVDFETQLNDLQKLIDSGGSDKEINQALSNLKPKIERDDDNPEVKLDEQMALMNENSVQYQSLLKGIQKKYAIMALAINGGKS